MFRSRVKGTSSLMPSSVGVFNLWKRNAVSVADIASVKVFPGIGIARAGNSPSKFFVGPEAPGILPDNGGSYKDNQGRIKRQAARFRVFAYDSKGTVLDELTSNSAEIKWEVHLANKKASYFKFVDRHHLPSTQLRNATIEPNKPPEERRSLIIDPGPRTIEGVPFGTKVFFDGGKFLEKDVPLGELRTDEVGRLLVLGGTGHAGCVKDPPTLLKSFANNDDWYDTMSDGPVKATVKLRDGRSLEALPSWVIVAPPKFAPGLNTLPSLYSTVTPVFEKQGWVTPRPVVSFYDDVYPILQAVFHISWVNDAAHRGHGPGKIGEFLTRSLDKYMDNSEASKPYREAFLKKVRIPEGLADDKTRAAQANYYYMPPMAGDGGDPIQGDPTTWLTVTQDQYLRLQKWAAGDFILGDNGVTPFEQIPLEKRPHALDKAALQSCVGGPFYPGIEMTYIATKPETYSAPYRIDAATHTAGDITRHMALPWQADFYQCNTHWWPATRPDDVVPREEYDNVIRHIRNRQKANGETPTEPLAGQLAARASWTRGLNDSQGGNELVKYWTELGFVNPKRGLVKGETVFVEEDRSRFAGMNERELFYAALNLDQNLDCLPKLKEFVEQQLAQVRRLQSDPTTPEDLKPFPYSPLAFEARLNKVYNDYVTDVRLNDPATHPVFKSREDVIERCRQFSPFNMSDGSWLRGLPRPGPIDFVRSTLFSVLQDEMGNGVESHNHSNIFRDLLHTLNIYPAPLVSRDFAFDPNILDSAYTLPLFELAISQFTESYYPELLGMTLQLEWGIVEAKNTIKLFNYYNIEDHYYVLHVGIDNPTNGHGARAVSAIQAFLDNIRDAAGEEGVQKMWSRIWDGYVAFATVGNLAADLEELLQKRRNPNLRAKMVQLIQDKAKYGSLNHDEHKLGAVSINEWFRDPEGFLDELVKSGMIIPGKPDASPLFELFSFETGRMFRVFTDEEIKLWTDWTLSLVAKPEPSPPLDDQTVARHMHVLVDALRERQTGSAGHERQTLQSPPGPDGTRTVESVAWWFQQSTSDLLAALSADKNGWVVPGNPDASGLVNTMLSPKNAMGKAFSFEIPNTGGRTGKEILIEWIKRGCPKFVPAKTVRMLTLNTPQVFRNDHPTSKTLGQGGVH